MENSRVAPDRFGRHPLADKLWDALLNYDTAALRPMLSPTFRRWLNATRQEMNAEQFLALMEIEKAVVCDPVAHLTRELTTDDGFVLMVEIGGHLESGETWEADVCLVVTASADHIERIDEYFDVRTLRPLVLEVTRRLSAHVREGAHH